MDKVIQVFKPQFRVDEVLSEIRDCLEKGWTGIGFKTEIFEKAWKEYSGFSNCHFLNSATSGLHLALNIFKSHEKWTDGDEIITTALTFVSTNHAIYYEDLTPVFADVDNSLCMTPTSVEAAITERTRAVIYVGLGGNAEHYRAIRTLCDRYNLRLILDAAHLAGSRWVSNNEHIGTDADCAVFSYQAVKNCPSADSGMICFNNAEYDRVARRLSWLGIDKSTYNRYSESSYKWRYDVQNIGFKYHGNSIMAAMCLVSLKYLDEDNAYRRQLSDIYDRELSDIPNIKIIRHSQEIISSRHLYQLCTENRDDLLDYLAKLGIYCGVHYINNLDYKPYANCRSLASNVSYLSERLISLPLHLQVTQDDAVRIAKLIKCWAGDV